MVKLPDGSVVNGYASSFVIPNGRAVSKFKYANAVAKRDEAEEEVMKHQKYAGIEEYVRDFLAKIIRCNLDYMYYSNIVESMEGWKDGKSFQKMMSVYPEYNVTIQKMPIPKHYRRMRDISFDKTECTDHPGAIQRQDGACREEEVVMDYSDVFSDGDYGMCWGDKEICIQAQAETG